MKLIVAFGVMFAIVFSFLFISGRFSPESRANYLERLGGIAGRFGFEDLSNQLCYDAVLLRRGAAKFTIEFESLAEADALEEHAISSSHNIIGIGRLTRDNGSGKLTFDIPEPSRVTVEGDMLDFRRQYRNPDAQHDVGLKDLQP
jgi:hypothetical protein